MIVMETEGIQSCSDKRSLKTPHRNIKTVLPCVCVCVFVRVCVWPFCFKSKQCWVCHTQASFKIFQKDLSKRKRLKILRLKTFCVYGLCAAVEGAQQFYTIYILRKVDRKKIWKRTRLSNFHNLKVGLAGFFVW